MNKFRASGLLLAFSLGISSVFAGDAPGAWPMPTPFPSVPTGANSATFPIPRLDWVARVNANNEKAAKVAGTIQLVFDGDSITDGWQGGGKAVWAERYGKLQAFDFGIGGDRTEHVLWRLSAGQMNGIHPKLIALMIGTNNLATNTPAQIAEGIKAIVGEYQKLCPDAVILLQAIFPRAPDAANPARAKIKEINKTISALADGKKVIFIDFGDKFLGADGSLSPEIMPDALHPNAKGYQIWADAIQPVIDQYFPKTQ